MRLNILTRFHIEQKSCSIRKYSCHGRLRLSNLVKYSQYRFSHEEAQLGAGHCIVASMFSFRGFKIGPMTREYTRGNLKLTETALAKTTHGRNNPCQNDMSETTEQDASSDFSN